LAPYAARPAPRIRSTPLRAATAAEYKTAGAEQTRGDPIQLLARVLSATAILIYRQPRKARVLSASRFLFSRLGLSRPCSSF